MKQQELQDQIEEQYEETHDTENATQTISDLPLLTPEIFESDRQKKFDVVEINISDQSARIVEKSVAPKLTKEILEERAKPIKIVSMPFNSTEWQVHVRHGRTLRLQIEHQRLLDRYKAPETEETPEERVKRLAERERQARNLMLSHTIANPALSYQGVTPEGENGLPIEEQSDVLVNALWHAHLGVNVPLDDEVYQIQVCRSAPIHANLLIGGTFETYPIGDTLKVMDMTDDDIEMFIARNDAQRKIWVTSMIASPTLSLNGEGKRGAFLVENLCEQFLATLYNGYRVVSVPEASRVFLQRFRR